MKLGGLSITEYQIWCEKEIETCLHHMTSAVQIRRELFLGLTENELQYHLPIGKIIIMEFKIQDPHRYSPTQQ